MRTPRKITAVLAICAASTLAAVSARAQEPALPVLDQRISLELRDVSAQDFFRTVQVVASASERSDRPAKPLEVMVEESFSATLTICLRGVTLRTALQAACESMGCLLSWREDADAVRVAVTAEKAPPAVEAEIHATSGLADGKAPSLDEPVTLALKDAKLVAVLELLSTMTGFGTVIDQSLGERTVSVPNGRRTIRESLDLLCAQAGCRWELVGPTSIRISAR